MFRPGREGQSARHESVAGPISWRTVEHRWKDRRSFTPLPTTQGPEFLTTPLAILRQRSSQAWDGRAERPERGVTFDLGPGSFPTTCSPSRWSPTATSQVRWFALDGPAPGYRDARRVRTSRSIAHAGHPVSGALPPGWRR